MKKKVIIITAAFAVAVLGVLLWFYGYYNNKSNDNLPNLTLLSEMDEAEVNKLLTGYRKIQLREVWKEPDKTASNEDVWIINESTALIVSYDNRDKVAACGFQQMTEQEQPSANSRQG